MYCAGGTGGAYIVGKTQGKVFVQQLAFPRLPSQLLEYLHGIIDARH